MVGTSITSRILLRERNEQIKYEGPGTSGSQLIIQDSVVSTLRIISFESYSKLSELLGLGKVKSLLKPDAVPSIFDDPASLKS